MGGKPAWTGKQDVLRLASDDKIVLISFRTDLAVSQLVLRASDGNAWKHFEREGATSWIWKTEIGSNCGNKST